MRFDYSFAQRLGVEVPGCGDRDAGNVQIGLRRDVLKRRQIALLDQPFCAGPFKHDLCEAVCRSTKPLAVGPFGGGRDAEYLGVFELLQRPTPKATDGIVVALVENRQRYLRQPALQLPVRAIP